MGGWVGEWVGGRVGGWHNGWVGGWVCGLGGWVGGLVGAAASGQPTSPAAEPVIARHARPLMCGPLSDQRPAAMHTLVHNDPRHQVILVDRLRRELRPPTQRTTPATQRHALVGACVSWGRRQGPAVGTCSPMLPASCLHVLRPAVGACSPMLPACLPTHNPPTHPSTQLSMTNVGGVLRDQMFEFGVVWGSSVKF